ncbi:MFS transporter [Peribacillus frigoritolerans]|jgi:putative MFS transporter|nr:MFS transporter [Peribacillus frigoritolerans]MCY9140435.1 MFS transporter [Peribacillus frigoritolerans]MED4688061.1 MFS transporter [Peribacillus frigoritolerans]
MSFVFTLVIFIIYGTFNTAMGAHPWIYPSELFPTHIRGTAMGFITGVTRIASSIGTFLFPMILASYGLTVTLYICGALFFLGFLVSLVMAPETKNMSLKETSSLNKSKHIEQDSFASKKTAN